MQKTGWIKKTHNYEVEMTSSHEYGLPCGSDPLILLRLALLTRSQNTRIVEFHLQAEAAKPFLILDAGRLSEGLYRIAAVSFAVRATRLTYHHHMNFQFIEGMIINTGSHKHDLSIVEISNNFAREIDAYAHPLESPLIESLVTSGDTDNWDKLPQRLAHIAEREYFPFCVRTANAHFELAHPGYYFEPPQSSERGHSFLGGQSMKSVGSKRSPKLPLVHPGDVLRCDFLEPRNISVKTLADKLGVGEAALTELVEGKRRIDSEIADALGQFFGTTQMFWMNLQEFYDLRKRTIEVR